LFKKSYRELVKEKNRKLAIYRDTAGNVGKDVDLRALRDDIDAAMANADAVMNDILRDQFEGLGVKFEQATWDDKKKGLGKPLKRRLTRADIDEQKPFHWGYVFDRILQTNGGFDIILTNPPWEVFKPQAKEFFASHSTLVSKNKMTIKEFEKEQSKLLSDSEVRDAWLAYESQFPHMNQFFRRTDEYRHQTAMVDKRTVGADLNLYKLFTERCFQLARRGGHVGIVIPSGIYTDLGAKGLRDLLFNETRIEGLFCFENRKEIFEGVHRSFKFVVLTFERSATPRIQEKGERNSSAPPDDLLAPTRTGELGTARFPAAFMRHDVAELSRFPEEGALWLDLDLIRKLSPDSHSVTEFKDEIEIDIAKKVLQFPPLGETLPNSWNLVLHRELHMTDDEPIFKSGPGAGRLPLIEGKMIYQFELGRAPCRYWVTEHDGRASLLGRQEDNGQLLSYQRFRIAHRSIASSTNERSMIATIVAPGSFTGNSLNVGFEPSQSNEALLLCALLNSYVFDFQLRQQVTANLNMFFIYQTPVPRISPDSVPGKALVERAAKLICTTPEFDSLAIGVGLRDHRDGVTAATNRTKLRAEIDGLVAHLYGLTESQFEHVTATFPLVDETMKQAALRAYRELADGCMA
jgi:hypothetical protein